MKGIAESFLLAGGGNRVCLSLFNTWSNNMQPAITHKSKSVIFFPPLPRILLVIFFSTRRHKQLCSAFKRRAHSGRHQPKHYYPSISVPPGLHLHVFIISSLLDMQMKCVHPTHLSHTHTHDLHHWDQTSQVRWRWVHHRPAVTKTLSGDAVLV